jgi:hypothetical protein
MTDDYFNTVSVESTLDVSTAKDIMTSSNIGTYKPSAAETLKKTIGKSFSCSKYI